MTSMEFKKPGKGSALYICKLKNLLRGTTLDRTYKGGDSLEEADIQSIPKFSFCTKQGDTFVFMDKETFDQHELTADQVGDDWKYLKDNIDCQMTFFGGNPIIMTPPNHVELQVEYCDPGAKGDTSTNVRKPVKVETGGEFLTPIFVNEGDIIRIDTRTGELCRTRQGLVPRSKRFLLSTAFTQKY